MLRPLACALSLIATLSLLAADSTVKIMRPADGAWLPDGNLSIIATAPAGKLFVDAKAVETEQPFPDVFHAEIELTGGEHVISIESAEGRRQVRVFVGSTAPDDFEKYIGHPPSEVACVDCHSLSRRGRFRFSGNCLNCHAKEAFVKTHSHEPHVLQSCGRCHNAHGSTTAKHLILAREQACKQCHN